MVIDANLTSESFKLFPELDHEPEKKCFVSFHPLPKAEPPAANYLTHLIVGKWECFSSAIFIYSPRLYALLNKLI